MKTSFDEAYYEHGIEAGVSCYSNYQWLPELTIPLAAQLIIQLGIKPGHKILDFGCAKGYLVRALHLLHYEAYGVDVSEYAITHAPQDVRDYLSIIQPGGEIPTTGRPFDWVIAKDVLEHVSYTDIKRVLGTIRDVAKNLMVIVPLGCLGKYVIPAYERDRTHQIREPLEWWADQLSLAGFSVTTQTHHMPHIKDNWNAWPTGNGFLIANRP